MFVSLLSKPSFALAVPQCLAALPPPPPPSYAELVLPLANPWRPGPTPGATLVVPLIHPCA